MYEKFNRFKTMLGLDESSAQTIRQLRPFIEAGMDRIVQGFYRRMRNHPVAMSKFPGGHEQLARQEVALRGWLSQLLQDVDLETTIDSQIRIGAVHLAATVDEELMVASMNWLREEIADVIRTSELPEGSSKGESIDALNRFLDFNLGLILSSYWRYLHERSVRADRLIQIGQYTAAINHELRNPLGVIGTSAYLLRETLSDDSSADTSRKHLDKIDRSVGRANSIIAGLLRLLRVEQPARQKISIEEFKRQQAERIAIPDHIEFEVTLDEDREAFGVFDPTQISQVIENLIQNSVDAMDGSGKIKLAFDVEPTGLVIQVRDNGPGIDSNILHQVFDPLFTTTSFGTGLGLTLAKAIVESHGGSLSLIDGLQERGIGFQLEIPHFLTQSHSQAKQEDEAQ